MIEVQWFLLDDGFHAYVDGKPTQWQLQSDSPLWKVVNASDPSKHYFISTLDFAKEFVKRMLTADEGAGLN